MLALNETAINKDDVITADADNVIMPFSGVVYRHTRGRPNENGSAENLEALAIGRSDDGLVRKRSAERSQGRAARNIRSRSAWSVISRRHFRREIRRRLSREPSPAKPEEKPADALCLKESAQPTTVILVGDADMIQDQIAVRELQTPGGQPMAIPVNGNLGFAQGAVEQLAGDSNLITVRSRASRERPFTVVQKMQADAESNYRNKIKELETSLSETQRKVNELQRSKDAGQRFILSPEQQQELTNFRKTEADVKTQLKEMRRKLRVGNRFA